MSIKQKILSIGYQPLKISNYLYRSLKRDNTSRLRVLTYHDVIPSDEKLFSSQLKWLSRRWRFLKPQEFSEIISGQVPLKEDSLLLTFDDGFASNRRIAERILKPLDIHAIFFIVSQFVSLENPKDINSFIANNFFPQKALKNIPNNLSNMHWNDLEYLLSQGHDIGGHTANHLRLSELQESELYDEIVSSADILEERLGVNLEHFAYSFGNLESFSPAALEIAKKRFKYIYTGLRGDNANNVPLWAIRRDAMQSMDHHVDNHSSIGALLEGIADRNYTKPLYKYHQWGDKST